MFKIYLPSWASLKTCFIEQIWFLSLSISETLKLFIVLKLLDSGVDTKVTGIKIYICFYRNYHILFFFYK